VILEDDESNTPDPEAAAVSALVDTCANSAFELSKPIDPSGPERWFDVETGCYVDEELPPGLEPEQEGLAASTPVHDHGHSRCDSPGLSHNQIVQYDNVDRSTQRTLEEPTPYSLPKPLDEDGRGSEETVSELERDMLLAFEEQDKSSSATAPSSPQPLCDYTGQWHAQVYKGHEQGRTSYSSFEGLSHGSPLPNQDQEKEELQEQQQEQEVAAGARRGGEEDGGEDNDREQQGKQGEKRPR
jgi:hypothetical protein